MLATPLREILTRRCDKGLSQGEAALSRTLPAPRASTKETGSHALLAVLRDAAWLESSRAQAYTRILLIVQGLGLVALLLSAHGLLDPRGEPIGTDFVSFWTAARMALEGGAASVYAPSAHHAAEQAVFGAKLDWYAFFYPPVYLLYVLPLGLLPYFAALAAWLGATLAAYLLTLRQIGAKAFGVAPLLAFPAVLSNIGHGQNALLSTALFAGGAALLERRPALAGMALGALCFKPQLALLIPLGLAVAGRWRALFALAAMALALGGLSYAAFGEATWRAFVSENALARATLEQGLVEPGKMQSVFTGLRLWGAPLAGAYAAQAVVSLAAIVAMILLLRRTVDAPMQLALVVIAGLLATPFVLDYDFTLLALPLTVMLARGLRDGFGAYEKSALLAAYILPALARPLALFLFVPISPLILALLFVVVARRVIREAP
jgi:hypothetical protein